jgi:predicted Zn finger-like uncharacterized protein
MKMRLTCPNCDAQYEVPDEVMPTSGRDVQCSNCGQTWFQHHPDHAPDDDDDIIALGDQEPDPDEEVSPPPPPPPAADDAPARRQLDPAVADILRQEAEAEHAARNRETTNGLETQPDLGLEETAASQTPDENERRMLEAKRRMARMRGEPDPVQAAALSSGPRRELLPDIEEINSTLRTDADRSRNGADVRGTNESEMRRKPKGGFRRGFILVLILVILLGALYVYAPQIARAVPQVDPYLSSYVGWVDTMRLWLDGQVKSILIWLDSMASQTST